MGRIVGIGMVGKRLLAALYRLLQRRDPALLAQVVHQRNRLQLDEVLGEIADRDPFAVRDLDRSRVQIDAPEDRPQERRLACPVVAD